MSATPETFDAHGTPPVRRAAVADFLEKCVLLGFYAVFLNQMLGAVVDRGSVSAALIGVSETMVLLLILFRKPTDRLSRRPWDWFLAFAATLMPLMFRPTDAPLTSITQTAVVLCFVGICFQIISKLYLGRRFGMVAAHRGLCSTGPYGLVRHPIYFGYLITHVAFVAASPSAWNLVILLLTYAAQIPRIFAEERLLRTDPEYAAYCEVVRRRLVPGLF